MAIHKLSGFELRADLTPRWWRDVGHRERIRLLPNVLATAVTVSPWICGIGYHVGTNRVYADLVIPADATLATMMAKREATLGELDKLKP